MQYVVVGLDGKEYGPVDLDTLKSWAVGQRVTPQTVIKDITSNTSGPAAQIPGLFPPPVAPGQPPPPAASYPRAMTSTTKAPTGPLLGSIVFWKSLLYPTIALICVFFLHSIAIVIAIYGVIYSFVAKSRGMPHGMVAIVYSIATVLIVGGAWLFLSGPAAR